jgi:hypothetical protein
MTRKPLPAARSRTRTKNSAPQNPLPAVRSLPGTKNSAPLLKDVRLRTENLPPFVRVGEVMRNENGRTGVDS